MWESLEGGKTNRNFLQCNHNYHNGLRVLFLIDFE